MISRWLDHLLPWLAFLALAGTRLYGGAELAFMALPLVAALSVELHRLDLSRWRSLLELGVLAVFALDIFIFHDIFAAVVHLLCVLSGLRLALPRRPRERRQLLLMSFLLFLTTAISTTDIAFLLLALLWGLGAMALLVQMAWERSAHLRRGLPPRAPFRKLPVWLGSSALLAAGIFLTLPRTTLGLRPLPLLQRRLLGTAGLGDNVDLAREGPIQDNDAVALRITPLGPVDERLREAVARQLGLLRGMALESVKGMRWEASPMTPPREALKTRAVLEPMPDSLEGEFFVSPSRTGILPLPYAAAWFRQPLPVGIRAGDGGSVRWAAPVSSGLPLKVGWLDRAPFLSEHGDILGEQRRAHLTALGPGHESARRFSFQWAPEDLPASILAARLEAGLQRACTYTLNNPSGEAANPLAHFLEVSHAGHCEYFASALALMLRARGVPARVATGYRLGPWIPEGGYFLVTQNQAHAWVEYWDDEARLWKVADPTPSAPLAAADAASLRGWDRMLDAMRYRWSRFVVRFSNQDQQEGLSWIQGRLEDLRPGHPRHLAGILAGLLLILLIWRTRHRWVSWLPYPAAPGGLTPLRPLLRRTRQEVPPHSGETLRAWLGRLAARHPHLSSELEALTNAAEAHVYGGGDDHALRRAVRKVMEAWRRPRRNRRRALS